VAGLVAFTGSVVAADVWAVHTDRPTISATVADALDHDWLGPVAFGVLAGLGWHLVVCPVLDRLSQTNNARGK
jgi:hypothetical protein